MDIRNRLFPYPVLSSMSDDYIESFFETAVDIEKEGFNLNVHFMAEVKNDDLNRLIADAQAGIIFHMECPETGFRELFLYGKNEVMSIPQNTISGRLQVCPFIVAQQDIRGYVNSKFHPDYHGFKFDIDLGCILGIGNQTNFDVESDIEGLAHSTSIFVVVKNDEALADTAVVDIYNQKIVISVPQEDYYNYANLLKQQEIQPILNSLIIFPTLVFVLDQILRRPEQERYEFSTFSWYRSLKKVLLERHGIDIESSQIQDESTFMIAQKVINTPLSESFCFLADGFLLTKEEED